MYDWSDYMEAGMPYGKGGYARWLREKIESLEDSQGRVSKYLFDLMQGQIGVGEDPIGFLIASHASINEDRKGLSGKLEAIEKWADGIAKPTIESQERLIAALRVAARYPLSGWQKSEADSEKRRAEGLFNDISTLRLKLDEVLKAAKDPSHVGVRNEIAELKLDAQRYRNLEAFVFGRVTEGQLVSLFDGTAEDLRAKLDAKELPKVSGR